MFIQLQKGKMIFLDRSKQKLIVCISVSPVSILISLHRQISSKFEYLKRIYIFQIREKSKIFLDNDSVKSMYVLFTDVLSVSNICNTSSTVLTGS